MKQSEWDKFQATVLDHLRALGKMGFMGEDDIRAVVQSLWKVCQRHEWSVVSKAFAQHLQDTDRTPTPASILAIIREHYRPQAPQPELLSHGDAENRKKHMIEFAEKFPFYAACLWGPQPSGTNMIRVDGESPEWHSTIKNPRLRECATGANRG